MSVRLFRHTITVLLCAIACLTLSSCAPAGRAVGDTQDSEPEVAHIGKIKMDMLIGLIGSTQSSDIDTLALSAFDTAKVNAVYSSTVNASDPDEAARQAVNDMIDRRATIIVLNEADVNGKAATAWNQVLRRARDAGIPVTMLNPISVPDDDTLFAATLTINDRATDAQPIALVLANIMDDKPHGREITVSTVAADDLNRP